VADGVPITHVAAMVGINRRFVYKWVQQFLHEGLQELVDKLSLGRKGSTRPPDLDGEAYTRIAC
jgi:transposase